MNKSKGFTIIELIVVIAIIAILAAIVLVNVTQYINKSKTSSIQANLSTIETSMAAWLADSANSASANGSAACAAVGTGSSAATAIANAYASAAFVCKGDASSTNWCSQAVTPTTVDGTNSFWCVDSTGYHGGASHACATGHYTCS